MHPPGLSPSANVPNMTVDEREYVFGHRQLAAIAFVVVGLLGIAAAMAYMAGRAAAPTFPQHARDSAPSRKTIVEIPVAKPSPSAVSPDPVPVSTAAPVNRPVTSASNPPLPVEPASAGVPAHGTHFFQVVSTDRAQAVGILDKLTAAGIAGIIGEGPSPDRVRVFAGPANDASSQAELRQKLEAAGFRPFLKKF